MSRRSTAFLMAQFHLQEVELHYTTGRYMRHPFLARSFEIQDVVGIVRLNFARRVRLYNGPVELAPGISLHPVGGHTPACNSSASIPAAAGSCSLPTLPIVTRTWRPA